LLGLYNLEFSTPLFLINSDFLLAFNNSKESLLFLLGFNFFFFKLHFGTASIDAYYIADSLFNNYLLGFITIGLVLLIAIVGVIFIGIRKSIFVKRQNISEQFFRYRN
jgi:hypothetical protein